MNFKGIILPKNCHECKCFVAVEEAQADYAGIIPRTCALLNEGMPSVWGIAIDRPEFCPLEKEIIDFKK